MHTNAREVCAIVLGACMMSQPLASGTDPMSFPGPLRPIKAGLRVRRPHTHGTIMNLIMTPIT